MVNQVRIYIYCFGVKKSVGTVSENYVGAFRSPRRVKEFHYQNAMELSTWRAPIGQYHNMPLCRLDGL